MKTSVERAKFSRTRVGLITALVVTLLLLRPAAAHLRAASLLIRFADPGAQGVLAGFGTHPIKETDVEVPGARGAIRGRIYAPDSGGASAGDAKAPGIVIIHGVHRLGIDEPRLQRFSRAVAAAGFSVLTPEVRELSDYRIDPASIDTIGDSAKALRERLGARRVGVIGMSFAGGLSLLTAADPRYEGDIGFVVAVGAHHDLTRVAKFFTTNRAPHPDGRVETLTAHEYGAMVLVYSHVESFFPGPDTEAARDAIRLRLHEQPDAAKARAGDLRPEARARLLALFNHDLAAMEPELTVTMERLGGEMARVSPSGRLASMKAPVFLLHGAGDTVIPASETLWLAKDVPSDKLRGALVSPAVVHVELDGDPPFSEKWALIRFMTSMLAEAESVE